MKKLLLFTFASFMLCATSFAQNSHTLSPEAEARCTDITRQMAQELRLNEPGYIKLKALNRELMAKTEEIKNTFSYDEALMKQKLQELTKTYDENIVSFLKPDQIQAYANFKKAPDKTRFVAVGEEY